MAEFQVTATELASKASNLRDMNTRFQSLVDSLSDQEANLATMWEGQAQAAFRTSFNNDRDQMTAFHTLIEKYCTTLEEIAKKYQEVENQNTETASNRTYH